MVREDKVQAVKDLEDLFKSANALVLAEYRGLTVSQQTKLRKSLKNAGASFNVVKMSLAKRAAENIGLDSLSDYFAGPTGVTIIDSDPVEAAKVLKEFSNENDAFVVKGGLMNSEPLTVEQFNVLANIDPRVESYVAKKLNLKIMLGCMVSSSLSMIPLLPLYQFADFIDLDGPCFISHDRENGLIYEKGMILLNRDLCWG